MTFAFMYIRARVFVHSTFPPLCSRNLVYQFDMSIATKGQLISEWLFDVLNFPKKQRKNLMNFCHGI
jgi:hypothetical protein